MKAKVVYFIIMGFVITFFLSGCWDFQEISERGIITLIGIDRVNETQAYRVSIQYLVPEKLSKQQGVSGDKLAAHMISADATTFARAFEQLDKSMALIPFNQMNHLILLGEDMGRYGIQDMVDYFMRFFENRAFTNLVLVHGKAQDYVQWESELTKIPAESIDDTVNSYVKMNRKKRLIFINYVKTLSTDTKSIYLKTLRFQKNPKGETEVQFDVAAIFKKYQMLDFLTEDETVGLLLIDDNLKKQNMILEAPEAEQGLITFHENSMNTKLVPSISNGKVHMLIDVYTEGSIEDNTGKFKLSDQENLKKVQAALNKKIKYYLDTCLNRVQKEMQSDVFGFGEAVYRKYPSEWKKLKDHWDEIYPDLEVSYHIQTEITGTNLIVNPILQGKEGY